MLMTRTSPAPVTGRCCLLRQDNGAKIPLEILLKQSDGIKETQISFVGEGRKKKKLYWLEEERADSLHSVRLHSICWQQSHGTHTVQTEVWKQEPSYKPTSTPSAVKNVAIHNWFLIFLYLWWKVWCDKMDSEFKHNHRCFLIFRSEMLYIYIYIYCIYLKNHRWLCCATFVSLRIHLESLA